MQLTADYMEQLIRMIRGRGYRFISLTAALRDPAYDQPDGYFGPAGITWLHRWAIARNMDRNIFRGEPEVPEWITNKPVK